MKKIFLASVSLFLAGNLYAASGEDLQVKRNDEEEWTEMVRGSDTVAMILYYVGTASEAVVEISDTRIRAFAPAGTADTTFGTTSSSYSFVTTTASTLGELCRVIDNLANYACELRAGRFSDLPIKLRDRAAEVFTNSSTSSLKQDGGFEVKFDTGGASGSAGEHGIYSNLTQRTEWIRVSHKPAAGKRSVWKKCTMRGSSGAFNLEFSLYGKPRSLESGFISVGKSIVPVQSSATNTSNRSFGPVIVSTVLARLTLPEPSNSGPVGVSSLTYTVQPDVIEFGAAGSQGGFEFGQDVIGIAEIIPADNGGATIVEHQFGNNFLWCSGVDR